MDREDVIRMARDLGMPFRENHPMMDKLERFAALVEAAKQEECAKVCDNEAAQSIDLSSEIASENCAAAIRALK